MDFAVLNSLSYGMYIVAAMYEGKKSACIINTCSQITNEPLTLAISLNKSNFTHETVKKSGKFSLSILSENINPAIISTFGFRKSDNFDKFDHVKNAMAGELPIITENSCGSILCTVISEHDMGTHTVFFATIDDTVSGVAETPMTYAYYHAVVKGKAPKTAPTYQPPQASSNDDYVCTVCGYVHKGDINLEPDDYKCPVCGAPKSKFKKM